MSKAVIPDWNQFEAYLAGQPLCQWSAKKQLEIAAGLHSGQAHATIHTPPKKNDNADLAAALASMA